MHRFAPRGLLGDVNASFKALPVCLFLLLTARVQAAPPVAPKPGPARSVSGPSDAERYARRCQSQTAQRIARPQGTMLWGTKRSWDAEKPSDERTSVLVSVALDSPRQAEAGVKALRFEGGRLWAVPAPETGATASDVVGTVLQGTASDGKPVEVAICGAEPAADDPGRVFYRIEAWNAVAREWENPCVALDRSPAPRALAVGGVWDASGAHADAPDRVTFACENGAISKCILWGYAPWASRDGQSLAGLHQACTRLARADYCGNGRSHTRQDTTIDIYDRMGVLERATEVTREWDPAKGSFEAAWAPDGATCLSRTRDGRALDLILQECPGRFQPDTGDAGEASEHCTVRRGDVKPGAALLRNLSYGPAKAEPARER
ncbi:ADYC domain-containing protein [Corallococcus exercitus]|uniref:ADYC domain-containing protein n=1 Tax=Corallococcus exercitus TaxID=2316736 RepID=UPI0034634F30